MTDTSGSFSDAGVIGDRSLHALQTVSIGRLTSHVIPIVPGIFVAVTGRGPHGDSNASGKTTFLGAMSLLLGDPQWRLSAGGYLASTLLFDPDPAGASASMWPSAERGYIVGLFAREDGSDPITVWLRLNASAPYLKLRRRAGLCFAEGETEAERFASADQIWSSIGASTGHELGTSFAATLYGGSPRCLAWIETRGTEASAPSLLSAALQSFKPEQIGAELVLLSGRAGAAEEDLEQRRHLDELLRALEERRRDDDEAQVREAHIIEDIERRGRAVARLAEAKRAWKLHYAAGLLETRERLRANAAQRVEHLAARAEHERILAELGTSAARLADVEHLRAEARATNALWKKANETAEAARTDTAQLRGDLRRAEQRRDELQRLSSMWDRTPSSEIVPQLESARDAHGEAVLASRLATRVLGEAGHSLAAAEAGDSGQAGAVAKVLRGAGLHPMGLLDSTVVAESARAEWEPRLSLYSAGVVLGPEEIDTAVTIAPPGAILISSLPGDLPEGIQKAAPAAAGFLRAIALRVSGSDGAIGIDQQVGVRIVGGFPLPIAGREARIEAARDEIREAEKARARAFESENLLKQQTEQLEARRIEAEAGEEVQVALAHVSALTESLGTTEREAEKLGAAADAALQVRDGAKETLAAQDALLEKVQEEIQQVRKQILETDDALRELDDNDARAKPDYWESRWGDSDDAAQSALLAWAAERGRSETFPEETLRKQATEPLSEVLGMLGLQDPAQAPTAAIAEAMRARSDANTANLPQTTDALLGSVTGWLDEIVEHDRVTAARIEEDRTARTSEIETTARTCESSQDALDVIQDSIHRSVEIRLQAVSDQLDRLNRASGLYGADLQISVQPPKGPADSWRWEVEPRWRRSPGGRMLTYRAITNSAQAKLFSVHLVVAALFASGVAKGRVLILDELGNSLGDHHRREVLRALSDVAVSERITVLGTCQNDLLAKASEIAGQTLYFERLSATDILNAATRFFGTNPEAGAVLLTADAVRIGRPLG